jgi:eukaryotic-like serine/threonine-protein kinase
MVPIILAIVFSTSTCQLTTGRAGHNIRRMAVPAPVIGAVLGHYRLLEHVGKGGMGVVFRARDERLDRDVAVKVLPPGIFPDEDARRRFRREARVLAKLNHPNVAMAFDFGQQNGIDYLVTEYVPGITLATKLIKGPLSQKKVIELGIQLASGLEAAHRQQIIHCDLKPANLQLTPDEELKILDFGLARWREVPSERAKTLSLPPREIMGGTLPYMAPEQIRCEELDRRTDIWGAGAVLYEMATGERPFAPPQVSRLMEAIQHLDPPTPSTLNRHLSPALDTIILKALDKDPNRRYQTARELGVDLSRLLPRTGSTGQQALTDFPSARRRPPWSAWSAWIMVTVVAAVVYGGYRLRENRFDSRQSPPRLLTVLPFDVTAQDEKTSALVMGLTETLTAKLAQPLSKDLQVISARDVRTQGVKTPEQAWKEFGSDLVLEGSAHRVGEQIRINCSLVDSRTHRQVTARTITAATTDAIGLEDQVANDAISLVASEAGIERPALPATRVETNPEAYASYLRARGYLQEYQRAENIDLAISELRNATALDPAYANTYAALGEAFLRGYQEANRGAEWVYQAEQNCVKSLAIRQTAEGLICLGDVHNETGKHDLAVQEFQRAVQIDPSNEDGLHGEADAYVKLGNPAGAEKAYQKAISLRPNYWGVHSWLGRFYYNQGRYPEAVTEYKKVIELAPNNFRGYSNLGAMYVAQGKYMEALAPLNKSIEIRPNVRAFNNLGNAYFELHQFSEAANAFQRGLNLDDSNWLLWGNLGDAIFWSGVQRPRAMAAYENAIAGAKKKLQVNPKDSTVLALSADYNAMIGHLNKAVEEIEQAMALAPANGEVRFRAAIVYNQLRDSDRCLGSLEKAIAAGYSPQIIRDTPDFDHLHNNPRFRALTQLHGSG